MSTSVPRSGNIVSAQLSILYTYNLRGDLDRLPRLHTFLRTLRAQVQRFEDDAAVDVCALTPPVRQVLLVDIGSSCSADVWHCAVTGGRSTVIVLDAMGYDAVHVSGARAPGARERLTDAVQLALVDAGGGLTLPELCVTAAPLADKHSLQLVLQPRDEAVLAGNLLYPARIAGDEVGVLHIASGTPRLSAFHRFTLPASTPPDPTIAGTVDFVLSEARYLQKKLA